MTRIGGIYNYYGYLEVKKEDGKFWWSIENWDGHEWEEISEELYNMLLKHNEATNDK
jgi:hypothetical protein